MPALIPNIDVPNLDAAIRFYTRGLGFELRRTLFDHIVAEIVLGDVRVYLIEHREGSKPYPGAEAGRSYRRHWTPVHLDIVVDNLDRALAKALAAGAVQSAEVSKDRWGSCAPLADPFGHGICLVEFSKEGYDAVVD